MIAGGAARAILEMAGIHDILAKSLGSSNSINVAQATVAGLRALKRPDEIARRRGKSPEEVTPVGCSRAYQKLSGPRTPPRGGVMAEPHASPRSGRASAPSPSTAARCGRSAWADRSDRVLPDRPEIRGMMARVPTSSIPTKGHTRASRRSRGR